MLIFYVEQHFVVWLQKFSQLEVKFNAKLELGILLRFSPFLCEGMESLQG